MGQRLVEEHGPERFGFAYVAVSVPIFENEEIAGVFSVITTNEKLDAMRPALRDSRS
jgi:hypothetical protein